jgi:micrococcal nuclease
VAVGRADHGARLGSGRPLLLGQAGKRQLAVLLAAAALAAGCGEQATGSGRGGTAARVDHVVDGDTVWLTGIGKVRLIGVDTPEVYGPDECFGQQASAYAKRVLAPGRQVRYRLGVEERDRYGRALAYVYLDDGRLFNELLAAEGYAQPLTIPPNDELSGSFVTAARHAREANRGLWRACR